MLFTFMMRCYIESSLGSIYFVVDNDTHFKSIPIYLVSDYKNKIILYW